MEPQYYWAGRRKPLTQEEIHKLTHFEFEEIIPEDLSLFDDLIPLEEQKLQPAPNQQKKKKNKHKNLPSQEPSSPAEPKAYQFQSPTDQISQPFISTPIKKSASKFWPVPQEILNTPVFSSFVPVKEEIPKNDDFIDQILVNAYSMLKKNEKPVIKQSPRNDSLMVKSQGNPTSLLKQQEQPIEGLTHSTNIKRNPKEQQNVENCEANENQKNLQLSFSKLDLFASESHHEEKKKTLEEKIKRQEEDKRRRQEEKVKREEEDKRRRQEERVKLEEEDKRRRQEERVKLEEEDKRRRQEERVKREEEEKMRRQEERVKLEEEEKRRRQEERVKREEEDKRTRQEERVKREEEEKRRKEQDQRERRKSIINQEQVRMELQSRRIRQEEERNKQEIDRMERQIEKDQKMRKKLNELKRTKAESTQKQMNALEQKLEKLLVSITSDIKQEQSLKSKSRQRELWQRRLSREEEMKQLNNILAEKDASIKKRIKQAKFNMDKELASLQKEKLKKADDKYLKQLKDMQRTLALNKLKQKNYQDFVYIDQSVLRLVNQTHSKQLAILLNEIRTKQTQIIKMIRSKQPPSINHYEALKTQLIDQFLSHPALRLQKQEFHQSMLKVRPPKSLTQIDHLWTLRTETAKRITAITQCLIGDIQFQIDKIHKIKLFPNSNIPEIQKQLLWNHKQQQLKKLYQQKHTLQDYNVNFYHTSFFRARQILQQAYTLCLEKQNNRNELFLLREFMNGAEIERKLDFYERSEMTQKMNESVQQLEYLKSELSRKNQTLKQIDQAYANAREFSVVEIIEKGKQEDQEVKKICQKNIQAYKQFVHDCKKREEDRKKMYSQGKVWKEDQIRKHRQIMERVKKDFLDNDATFINVYNREKHSSARAQPKTYKEYQKLPNSAPRPCKQQLKKQPQLRQVSLLESEEEVPVHPIKHVRIFEQVPEPQVQIQKKNIMPVNEANPANPLPPQAIDSGVDYGSMILKEIPELKDLQQIIRNRCIDSEAPDQEMHLHLFEFRSILAQSYLAVCLQKNPHQIIQRIDSLVQKDQRIVDFFKAGNVHVPQVSANYIRSFANGFKQAFQTGVKTQIRLAPFEINQQNPLLISPVC